MEGRFTISNMAIEAGGKARLMTPDDVTLDYVQPRQTRVGLYNQPDADAVYQAVHDYDVFTLEPMVSLPSSPANAVPLSKAPRVEIDQVFIGSCTNGRLADLLAASVMRGRKVHENVRCIVIPATNEVYLDACEKGWSRFLLRLAALFQHLPAAPAWAVTWASWPTASAVSAPPTATLSGGWATLAPKSILPALPLRPPAAAPADSPARRRY